MQRVEENHLWTPFGCYQSLLSPSEIPLRDSPLITDRIDGRVSSGFGRYLGPNVQCDLPPVDPGSESVQEAGVPGTFPIENPGNLTTAASQDGGNLTAKVKRGRGKLRIIQLPLGVYLSRSAF